MYLPSRSRSTKTYLIRIKSRFQLQSTFSLTSCGFKLHAFLSLHLPETIHVKRARLQYTCSLAQLEISLSLSSETIPRNTIDLWLWDEVTVLKIILIRLENQSEYIVGIDLWKICREPVDGQLIVRNPRHCLLLITRLRGNNLGVLSLSILPTSVRDLYHVHWRTITSRSIRNGVN